MAKVTMIELEAGIDHRKSFNADWADRIMRMKPNYGWHLPEDSEWTWSADKGFEKKANPTQKAQKAQKGTAENGGEMHE